MSESICFGTGCVRGSPRGLGEVVFGQGLVGNLQCFLRRLFFPGDVLSSLHVSYFAQEVK